MVTRVKTGNTVFAALGVSDLPVGSPSLAWTKSLCSVVCYLLGSFVSGSYHRTFGERKRWVLAVSFTFQAALILISGVLVQRGQSSGSPVAQSEPSLLTIPADPSFPWADLVPIGLLSFQSAMKVISSRVLEYTALPVVVLTTLYSDLISDPSLFSAGLISNVQRNRRAGGVVFYFAGAMIGGVASSRAIGFSGGLFIAALIQIATAAAWLLWRGESEKKDDEED